MESLDYEEIEALEVLKPNLCLPIFSTKVSSRVMKNLLAKQLVYIRKDKKGLEYYYVNEK